MFHMTRLTSIYFSIVVVLTILVAPTLVRSVDKHLSGAITHPQVKIIPSLFHSNPVNTVAISPDGKWIASGSSTIKLWEATTGRLVRTFVGHPGGLGVQSLVFSPNSKLLVSGGNGDPIKIWDLANGERLHFLTDASKDAIRADHVALSNDGRVVAYADFEGIKLRDLKDGHLLKKLKGSGPLVFSADSSRLFAQGENGKILVYNAQNGRRTNSLVGHSRSKNFVGPHGENMIGITALVLSPDGHYLATSSADNTFKIWHAGSGKYVRTVRAHKGAVNWLTFTPDSQRIVTAGAEGKIKIWNLNGTLKKTLVHEKATSLTAALSADGQWLVFSGNTQPRLTILDMTSATAKRQIQSAVHVVTSVDGSPDSQFILSGGWDKVARLWDLERAKFVRSFRGHKSRVESVAISPNGKLGATLAGDDYLPDNTGNDGAVRIWDLKSGKLLRTIQAHKGMTSGLSFSPDSTKILSSGGISGGTAARIWDVKTGRLLRQAKEKYAAPRAVFSPDGRDVITGNRLGNKIKRFSVVGRKRIKQFFYQRGVDVQLFAFTPDGTHLFGSVNSKVAVWKYPTGKLLGVFADHKDKTHHGITALAISPGGDTLLTGAWDRKLKLWSVSSEDKRPLVLSGHQADIRSAVFLKDGKRLVSSSSDGTIRVWDKKSGQLIATLISNKGDEWIIITPEGFFTASKNGAKMLSVVQGLELSTIDQLYNALYRPDLVREKLAGDPRGLVKAAAAKLDLDKIVASGMSPNVSFVSPSHKSIIQNDQVTAKIRIEDQGGGIGRIEWRVNGRTLGIGERTLGRIGKPGAKSITASKSLWLDPGKNVIEVVAYNKANLIASDPARVIVNWSGETSKTPPDLYVLAIGVNDYWDGRLRLNFARPDAVALSNALQKAGQKLYKKVHIVNLLDSDVTSTRLAQKFADLGTKVKPRDVFVFYLAGHGKTVDGKYYFIPQDFRYRNKESITKKGIGQDQWQKWFSQIPARKSLLLYDTCESGSLTGARIATRGMEHVAALEKLTRAIGRTTLSASTDDAPALEGFRGHGVFTWALLEALSKADSNKNNLIEITELASHIDARVPEISHKAFGHRQVPQMNIVGSNFPLTGKIATLVADAGPAPSTISRKPTHVVLQTADLFKSAGGVGIAVKNLAPGTTVTLVRRKGGWVLIAKEGRKLGFVAKEKLAPMQ